MAPKRTLVTGANGQLGVAVRKLAEKRGLFEFFDFTDRSEFDFSSIDEYNKIDWTLYGTVVNCGAYTAVDAAEAPEGRKAAWAANAYGPALLANVCAEYGITLVHISSDYVFDGTAEKHAEDEPFSPLGVYGQTKAAGDIAVTNCLKHYIVRSSWVIGEGENFVKTMAVLSDRCANPNDSINRVTVVNDQLGRLTFTEDMAEGIFWLLGYRRGDVEPSNPCEYGIYNLTGSGRVASWADIAAKVFEYENGNANSVVRVSTTEYYANVKRPVSPRPVHSALVLDKLGAAGFQAPDWEVSLKAYLDEGKKD